MTSCPGDQPTDDDYRNDSDVPLLDDDHGHGESSEGRKVGLWSRVSVHVVFLAGWTRKNMAIEPLLVLYVVAGFPLMTIRSQFMFQKVAQTMGINITVNGNDSKTGCDVNISDPHYRKRELVQAEAANWNMYLSLVSFLPGFVMTLFYGIYSDRVGRRIAFILPPIGSMTSTLVYMAVIYFDLPIAFLFLEVIEYFFGGMHTMFLGAFAYIADTHAPKDRGFRMAVLDVVLLLGGAVSNLFVGYWIKADGFFWPLVFVLGGKSLTLLYAIFIVPESLKPQVATSKKLNWKHLKHGFMLYLKDDGTSRRWKLNTLLFSYLVAEIITAYRVMTLYEMNAPLCWNSVFIGYFMCAGMIVKCIATLLAAGILKRWFRDETLALVARITSIAENLYLAFVTTTLMMFFAPAIGAISFLAIPMTRAVMSRLVGFDEQGSMFAVMTCASNVASLISSLAVNQVYAATLLFMAGFIFILGAIFGLISGCLLLFYILKSRSEEKRILLVSKAVSVNE